MDVTLSSVPWEKNISPGEGTYPDTTVREGEREERGEEREREREVDQLCNLAATQKRLIPRLPALQAILTFEFTRNDIRSLVPRLSPPQAFH